MNLKNNNLIGIHGKIGSGKDTIELIIQFLCFKHNLSRSGMSFMTANPDLPFEIFSRWHDIDKEQYSGWEIKKFAGKLKQIVSLLTGYRVEELEYQSIKDTVLPDDWWSFKNPTGKNGTSKETFVIPYHPDAVEMIGEGMINRPTVRDLLQKVGTEAMRDVIHTNIWVNALFSDFKTLNNCTQHSDGNFYTDEHGLNEVDPIYPNWIITDCRFPNEAEAIRSRKGILIKTIRDQDQNTRNSNHPSETSLDSYTEWDYIIHNNGTIEELIMAVESILRKEKILI